MKFTGTTYRPPMEASTALLQVTVGCTHNKCTFCTMYKGQLFSIETIEQIKRDLEEARRLHGSLTRIFLVNGDAFAMGAARLKEIARTIISYFPEMETITMYASIRNIRSKSDKELQELKELRINDLWVGLESGDDEALSHMNKGFTVEDAYRQLSRLNATGIRHNGIYMLGIAGHGRGLENAVETARLINATRPRLVGVTTLGVFDGSKLAEDVASGTFTPPTELEVLEEEKKLIELIEVDNIPFFGSHPLNAAYVAGILPDDRDDMIDTINDTIRQADDAYLQGTASRSSL